MRVRALLLFDDWGSSTPALATHAVVTALVMASIVLLLVLTSLPWSSPDHATLSLADVICSVMLLADWLLRCGLYFSLCCSRKALLRSLTPKIQWLIVDGVASSAHVLSAAFTLIQFGDKLAVDLIACLRVLRLTSLVRNSKTFDMVLTVMWHSADSLKGPMYWMLVSTVLFAVVVFYIEFFFGREIADIDTLGNAIWFSIVTFSTVGYGDISPQTWPGKTFATFGIVLGSLWVAMPITIIGNAFQEEWERCNVRLVAEALQTELIENDEMSQDLVPATALSPPGRRPSNQRSLPRPSISPPLPCPLQFKRFCQIDTNGTHELDEQEFATFLKSHRTLAFMSADEARKVFQILDPLHRGIVTYKELARAVFPVMDVASSLSTTWNSPRESQRDRDAAGSYYVNEGTASPRPAPPPHRQTTAVSTSADAVVERDAALKNEFVQLKAQVDKLQVDVLTQVDKLQMGQKDMLARLDKVLAGMELANSN